MILTTINEWQTKIVRCLFAIKPIDSSNISLFYSIFLYKHLASSLYQFTLFYLYIKKKQNWTKSEIYVIQNMCDGENKNWRRHIK